MLGMVWHCDCTGTSELPLNELTARLAHLAGAGQSSRQVREQLMGRAVRAASIFALTPSCLAHAAAPAWM